MLNHITKKLFAGIFAAALFGGTAFAQAQQGQAGQPGQQAQAGQPGQPQKNWKPGEYDLYTAVTKATDPDEKIKALNQWAEKFKESDYADIRTQLFLDAYSKKKDFSSVLRVGTEALAQNPKDIRTLYIMSTTTLQLTQPTPEDLANGEKAARALATNIDELKPAGISDADWAKAKNDMQSLGHTVLGWVAMQRKDNEAAEKEFTQSLVVNPNNAQVSYWLGLVSRGQKTLEKQSTALYHFARAAAYDGPGALNEAGRKEMMAYLEKAYVNFHGDKNGLPELLQQAKTSAVPPAGFKIKSSAEIAIEKEEEFKKTNPMLALWMSIRKELASPTGAQYFESNVKGAALPGGANGIQKFKGTLITHRPAANPKELVLGVADANTPEVTLKLDAPMTGKAPAGTVIEFEGVASGFTSDPFMITFDAEKAKISGWPAPTRRPAAGKAGARKGGKKR